MIYLLRRFVYFPYFAGLIWSYVLFKRLFFLCFFFVLSGWFGATQAFETIGLIAGFVGLILTILYIFVTQTTGNRVLFIIDLLAVGIAGM